MAMAVARPGPWGCFLFCEHVVFSIQNNKRGSSGFVCGGVTARPGPGPAGVPTWAALQPAFWSLGRSGGARGGAGPAQPPLSPARLGSTVHVARRGTEAGARGGQTWVALPQPRAETLRSRGPGCLGPAPGRAVGEQGRELARPPGVPSAWQPGQAQGQRPPRGPSRNRSWWPSPRLLPGPPPRADRCSRCSPCPAQAQPQPAGLRRSPQSQARPWAGWQRAWESGLGRAGAGRGPGQLLGAAWPPLAPQRLLPSRPQAAR